ncbi:MAG: ABC transporter permease [Deltaproteobacteria bacterium]|nr:ABC transporter permease [Deltaproteobacteria bacterium]
MRLQRWLLPLSLLLLWQVVCQIGLIPAFKLPSPLQVGQGLLGLYTRGLPPGHGLAEHLFYSLYRVGLGFLLAGVIGLPLGVILGWSPRLHNLVSPLVEIMRPVPPLAWIPISILWFGIGIRSAAFIIFLGAFFPILLNTIAGVASTNLRLVEAAKTLGANSREIMLKVMLPYALPSIFVGLRVGMGIGWMTLVAAEFTGVKSGYGLGYMIMTARDISRADQVIAGMVVIGLVGLGIDLGIRKVQALLIPWDRNHGTNGR